MNLLDSSQIEQKLSELSEWHPEGKTIWKLYVFGSFRGAIEFLESVADIAEENNHHPDIFIKFNQVKLIFSTWRSGGVTQLDFDLAKLIDEKFSSGTIGSPTQSPP
jgi:4a-hydroxytetrahydrobiopterin dehydratase